MRQLDLSACGHGCLQFFPGSDLIVGFFLQVNLCDVAMDSLDLTVAIDRYMQGLLRHTCLCRQVDGQVIDIVTTVFMLRSSGEVSERNIDRVGTTHEGSTELISFISAAIADHTGVCAVTGPNIVTKRCIEFCQRSKHIHVRHYRLDVVVNIQMCLSGIYADGRTACVDLHNCQVIECYFTFDSRITACRVIVNQATGHPEALCVGIGDVVIDTTTHLIGMVALDLATVEGERTIVVHTTTFAGCVTTGDLTVASLVHDSEHTVIDDDTTVSDSACERTVNSMSVQFEKYGLVRRYDQCFRIRRSGDVLRQFDDSACGHGSLQFCPCRDRAIALLRHFCTSVNTRDAGDFTVAVDGHMQDFRSQTGLCRQVDFQSIGMTTIIVGYFLCRDEIAELQEDSVSSTHERSTELFRIIAAAITDHTCLGAVTRPYLITQRRMQFCQNIQHCRFSRRNNTLQVGETGFSIFIECDINLIGISMLCSC